MDPAAEEYYSISPYVYVANNPMKWIDPDGKRIGEPYQNMGRIFLTDGAKTVQQMQARDIEVQYVKPSAITNSISLNFGIVEWNLSSTDFHKGDGAKYVPEGNPDSNKKYSSGNIGITDLGLSLKRELHYYEGSDDKFGTEQIEGQSVGGSAGVIIQFSYTHAKDEDGNADVIQWKASEWVDGRK